MATHSSILVQRLPGTEKPRGLWFLGLHIVRHDWSDLARMYSTGLVFFLSCVVTDASHISGPGGDKGLLDSAPWSRHPGSLSNASGWETAQWDSEPPMGFRHHCGLDTMMRGMTFTIFTPFYWPKQVQWTSLVLMGRSPAILLQGEQWIIGSHTQPITTVMITNYHYYT